MALVLADRVKETTTSTGTTAITLAGAATGYQTFSSAVGNANTTYYTIADQTGANWEVGIGTYTSSGNTLSRDTILASSNAGSLVTFTAGTKDVFVTYPAERALYTGGPLGTPSSGTLTNATGYTYANLSGTVPTWNQNTTGTAAGLSATLSIASGGTNSTATPTAGGAGYGTGTAHAYTAAGTAGQVLTSNGAAAPTWTTASGGGSTKTISNKTGAYTVVSGDLGTIINCTANSFTVSLTAAATLGAGFTCTIWNTSNTSTHAITIDPAGAETIDGVATLILRRGEGVDIVCDGTNWQTSYKKTMRAYVENINNTVARPIASNDNTVSIGSTSQATGTRSFSFGYGSIASNSDAYAIGYTATASGDTSFALGTSSTASGTVSLALGPNTTASSTRSVAIGSNSGGTGSQAVTGAGAMALGGSYASGTDSFAAGVANNTSSYGAKGTNSLAVGKTSLSSGFYSTAIGRNSVASGNGSLCICTDDGSGYTISATGGGSVAIGSGNKSIQFGKYTYGSGRISAEGDAQAGKLVLRMDSTSAVALTSNYAAAGTTNQLVLQSTQAVVIQGTLIGRLYAGGTNQIAAYNITGAATYDGTTITGTGLALTLIGTDSIGLTAAPTIAVNSTYKSVTITSGYKTASTIRWVATLNTTEVTG
jgi:hypothetical protein